MNRGKIMGIKSVIDFVYSHTDEDFVIVDCDILDEVYEDMKNKKDLAYSVSDIKAVKDDIIETLELSDEQVDELDDFVKEVDSYVNGDKIEEKLRRLR